MGEARPTELSQSGGPWAGKLSQASPSALSLPGFTGELRDLAPALDLDHLEGLCLGHASALSRWGSLVGRPDALQLEELSQMAVDYFLVCRLERLQPQVVDQASLLLGPLAPAVGASLGEDGRAPFAGQRRLLERGLRLAAAAAGHVGHVSSSRFGGDRRPTGAGAVAGRRSSPDGSRSRSVGS